MTCLYAYGASWRGGWGGEGGAEKLIEYVYHFVQSKNPATRGTTQSRFFSQQVFPRLNLSLPAQGSPSPAPSSGPGPVALACGLRRLALARGPPRVPVRRGWLPVARSATGTPWRAPRLGVWGTSGRGARWHGMGARGRQKRPFEFPIL